MKKLIITATFFEARPILQLSNWEKKSRSLYQSDSFDLIITGIGRKNVVKAFSKLDLSHIESAVNIGICGGIKGLSLGDYFEPDWIGEESELQNSNICGQKILISLENPMKNSLDFLEKYPQISSFPTIGVDMEGAFLKVLFLEKRIPISFIKIFSDSGEQDFNSNFTRIKEILHSKIQFVAKKHLLKVAK